MSRIALITGGSRGLGRSAALHLARAGVGVLITYRSNANYADEVVALAKKEGVAAAALALDVTDFGSFAGFAAQAGGVLKETFGAERFDYLVNNAGEGAYASFVETTADHLDAMYDQHVKGPFLLTQAMLPLLADGGRILNVSSGLTRMTFPGYAAYSAAKGAIEVVSRYMAQELASRRIAVNTIAPGAIETDFGGGAVRDTPELNRQLADATAMGRVGLPDDIGGAVAGFLTMDSQWMTGQRIEVSGGQGL